MENNQLKQTVTITRSHDKICILEELLEQNRDLEMVVSKWFDYSLDGNQSGQMKVFNILRNKIKDVNLLRKIIELCNSICQNMPLLLEIDMSCEGSKHIVEYLERPYVHLF